MRDEEIRNKLGNQDMVEYELHPSPYEPDTKNANPDSAMKFSRSVFYAGGCAGETCQQELCYMSYS